MRTLLLLLILVPDVAWAQEGADDSTMGKRVKAPKDAPAAKGAKDPKDKTKVEPLEIHGRAFARSEAESLDSAPWIHELKLDSARIAVSYRWKNKLRVKATAELAGNPEVKDAYIDLDGPSGLDLRAGYFKVPISVIENTSAWDLPTVDRGVVAEIIEDGLGLSGRRDGAMVDWESPSGQLKLGLMLSQSVAVDGSDPARPLADGGGVMVTGRAELQLCPCLRLGAHVSNRETNFVADVYRYWAAGVDAEVDLDSMGHGLRLWADVMAGQDHFYAITRDRPRATFASAQAVAGWRVGGARRNAIYVEPFVGGGYFNPSVDVKRDDILDGMIGVNAGRWQRWRVQGQVEVVTARALRPSGLEGIGKDVNDAIKVVVQLGAAF
jgi:hypothetical protein